MLWSQAAKSILTFLILSRADSRFAPSQWQTVLLCNDVSHWLGTNLESAMLSIYNLHLLLVSIVVNIHDIPPYGGFVCWLSLTVLSFFFKFDIYQCGTLEVIPSEVVIWVAFWCLRQSRVAELLILSWVLGLNWPQWPSLFHMTCLQLPLDNPLIQ